MWGHDGGFLVGWYTHGSPKPHALCVWYAHLHRRVLCGIYRSQWRIICRHTSGNMKRLRVIKKHQCKALLCLCAAPILNLSALYWQPFRDRRRLDRNELRPTSRNHRHLMLVPNVKIETKLSNTACSRTSLVMLKIFATSYLIWGRSYKYVAGAKYMSAMDRPGPFLL